MLKLVLPKGSLERAVAAPTSRVSRSSMAWRRSGSAADSGLATTSVKEVSRVAITTMPWLRRVEPVSVRSTTASTISGTLASVAPWEGKIRAASPRSAKKRLVRLGNSVETRSPGWRSWGRVTPRSRWTASTTLTGLEVCLE